LRSTFSHLTQLRLQPALTDHASRVTDHASRFTHPLYRIQNWPQLAHEAKYSVSALAHVCGISVRVLERFFLVAFGCEPRQWLKELRLQRAIEILRDGSNVNETADRLGYHDRSHFSREFKKHYGLAPKNYAVKLLNRAPNPKLSHSAT
jgi:AraC-like DNA-binding protein